jgi:hypothetical protein
MIIRHSFSIKVCSNLALIKELMSEEVKIETSSGVVQESCVVLDISKRVVLFFKEYPVFSGHMKVESTVGKVDSLPSKLTLRPLDDLFSGKISARKMPNREVLLLSSRECVRVPNRSVISGPLQPICFGVKGYLFHIIRDGQRSLWLPAAFICLIRLENIDQ